MARLLGNCGGIENNPWSVLKFTGWSWLVLDGRRFSFEMCKDLDETVVKLQCVPFSCGSKIRLFYGHTLKVML